MRKKVIFVAGTSLPAVGQDIEGACRVAGEVGAEIARKGCILLCGGMEGVMEAACRGSRKAGGTSVCIIPTENRGDANKFCDIVVASGIGYARNFLLANSCDAMILVQGNIGTLIEASAGYFRGIPIIAVEGSGGVADTVKGTFLDENRRVKILTAKTAREAVELALNKAK